jgi:hypothetical protein
MIKDYTLFLHFKQGDDFNCADQDFATWCNDFEECVRQTKILSEHQNDIEVTGADTHHIGLRMEEDLANKLIEQDISISLEEWDEE